MEEFDYEELRIATDNFSPSRIIGRGSHGCVYNGNLIDGRTVAVKKLSSALQIAGDNSKLDNEVSILSSLSPTIKLINIVRLLGFSRGSSPQDNNNNLLIVMEFMPNGSLHDLLHDDANDTTSTAPISTWPGRVRIATQIARAVQFLHGASIVHRDVKSSNVLFDREWTAKLSDFGLALRLPSTLPQPNPNSDDDRETPPAGTIGYLDPSYVEPSNFSTKNDVFSFGALLLEIFSRRKAFDVSKSPPSLVDWAPPLIKSGCSLDKICDIIPPDSMRDEIKRLLSLAARCVSPHQRDRPSMDEVVVDLEICSYTAVVVGPVVAGPLKWTGFLRLAHVMVMRKGRMTWKTMTVRRRKRRTVPADTVAGIVATTTTSTNISTSLKCSAAQQIEYVHKHKGMMLKDFLADVCNVDIAVELN